MRNFRFIFLFDVAFLICLRYNSKVCERGISFRGKEKTHLLTCVFFGAGDGNRTRVTSLEGWSSTTELRLQNFFFLITGGSDEDRTRDLLRDRETC